VLVPFSVYWTYPALNVLKLYRGPFTVFGRIGNGVEGNDSVMGRVLMGGWKRRCNLLWILMIGWTKV
jgi:hypothetical protein